MAKENVMKFEEQVMKDEKLQKKLEEATKAYQGDTADEKAVFEAVIVPVAKEAGLEFTFEEAAEAQKAAMDGEIDLKEMKAVAGGIANRQFGFCIIVGSGEGSGFCLFSGFSDNSKYKGSTYNPGPGIGGTNCDKIGWGFGFGLYDSTKN